jgi:hypothetical protein
LIYVPYFFWGPWTKKRVIEGFTERRVGMRAID